MAPTMAGMDAPTEPDDAGSEGHEVPADLLALHEAIENDEAKKYLDALHAQHAESDQ